METREFKTQGLLQSAWLRLENWVNLIIASAYNPFYYLGALSIFFLWIILVSGIYLFIFYNISARGAYISVQNLTVNQWYLGGVMRSLHRYASDGLIITMLLHAFRCFSLDRFRHSRWVAWVSGVFIALVIWIGGIFGYWMVWDERAKFVAVFSAQLLENIPIFGIPLSLNFARIENLTDQLFYIILFIHFSTIFFIFILILVHISRVTKSIINPPRIVGYATVLMLLAISFINPAASGAPAELKILPQEVPFDWFYMFIFPLLKYMSARQVWVFIIALTLIIAIVPWLGLKRRKPAVKLALENCTGCELCKEDCPYNAIQMRKRTDGMPYPVEAVVNKKKCASCGICVGACDYKALDLPDITEDSLKQNITGYSKELSATGANNTVMAFVCAEGAWPGKTGSGGIEGFDNVRVVSFPCIGMLQPSMVSIPFEKGVKGVFIAGCRHGDCRYRRGNEWLRGRILGFRPPVVRKSIDRTRIKSVWLSAAEKKEFREALSAFSSELEEGGKK